MSSRRVDQSVLNESLEIAVLARGGPQPRVLEQFRLPSGGEGRLVTDDLGDPTIDPAGVEQREKVERDGLHPSGKDG